MSFCEYFAGVHLAEQVDDKELVETLDEVLDNLRARERSSDSDGGPHPQAVSPRARWRWVFRFALARASANARESGNPDRLNRLAGQLLAHGDPYVVHESIAGDGIEVQLDEQIAKLTRWLVHQTWRWGGADLRKSWRESAPPAVGVEALKLLRTLFDRRFRNGPVLAPAWQLVESCLPAYGASVGSELEREAVGIRGLFFGDLEAEAAGALSGGERALLGEFLGTFVACPPAGFDFSRTGESLRRAGGGQYLFRMGASPDDDQADGDERPRHWVRVGGMEMADFCVTNGLLELMDPSHFWYRDRFSRSDDQPALWVNWYTATLFGQWLSAMAATLHPDSVYVYRLPTECEWEFAARGGKGSKWWWGDRFSSDHCNSYESRRMQTLGRSETTSAYRNDFGLYHMAGNNWQWCRDVYEAKHYARRTGVSLEGKPPHEAPGEYLAGGGPAGVGGRVCRGGSFVGGARLCRSSYRVLGDAVYLNNSLGFRLCRVCSFSESSSDTLSSDL